MEARDISGNQNNFQLRCGTLSKVRASPWTCSSRPERTRKTTTRSRSRLPKRLFQLIARGTLGLAVLWAGAFGRNAPDIPATRTIGIEINPLAVRGVLRTIVIGALGCQALFVAPCYRYAV